MRLGALLLLASTSSAAFAQAVDCEALKTTTLPYQISYRHKNAEYVNQVYRDNSGDFVLWQQISTELGVRQVSKSTIYGVFGSDTFSTTAQTGKNKHRKTKTATSGVPKGFDRRSDVQSTTSFTTVFADGSTEQYAFTVAYRFVREARKEIGGCILQLVQGENSFTRDGKTLPPQSVLYLPELRGPVMGPADADAEFNLTTQFTPVEFLK